MEDKDLKNSTANQKIWIKKLTIINYKNIKKLNIEFNEGVNAIIGLNGVGKTTVIEVLNFLFGTSYPMDKLHDKKKFEKNNHDEQTGEVMDTLFKVQWSDGKVFTYKPSDDYSFKINESSKNIGIEREKKIITYISTDREASSILPKNKWTLLGKLFYSSDNSGNRQKLIKDVEELLNKAADLLKEDNEIQSITKTISDTFSKQIGKDSDEISVNFKLHDPKHIFKTMHFINSQNNLSIEEESSGIQNSFVISTFRAIATLKDKTHNPIVIDEPELYLHPSAKKALYKTLSDLSKNAQIIYVTHSSEFLSLNDIESIKILTINEEGDHVIKQNNDKNSKQVNEDKNKHFKSWRKAIRFNEGFFAKKVILVEGSSDWILFDFLLDKIYENYHSKNICLIDCNGKEHLKNIYEIYSKFDLDMMAIYDYDYSDTKIPKTHSPYCIAGKIDETSFENKEICSEENLIAFKQNTEQYLFNETWGSKEKEEKMSEKLADIESNEKYIALKSIVEEHLKHLL